MNITIKITHSNGTVMDIAIPMLVEQPVKTPPVDTSAVVMPKDDDMASEPAFAAQDAPSTCHEVEPVLSETKSLDANNNIPLGKEKVGEDGVGVGEGKIGGVGEREGEERVGEGEGDEENLEVGFVCSDGNYNLPTALYNDFVAAFGVTMVDRELTLARLWCQTNPQKRKTRRGMGRFLNAWMCRAQGEKRVPISSRGSLLDAVPSKQEGW